MNHEEIKEQAKRIMDDFMKELSAVEQPEKFGLAREQQMREPATKEQDPRFRQLLFENAPKVKDNLLIMEKKQW